MMGGNDRFSIICGAWRGPDESCHSRAASLLADDRVTAAKKDKSSTNARVREWRRRRMRRGGLPASRAAAVAASRRRMTPALPRTSRGELLSLLKRKSWQVRDVDRHPVVLGVPLGQNGGPAQAVSIDVGLKNPAAVSVSELVDAAPALKEVVMERALADAQSGRSSSAYHEEMLRNSSPVPMSVCVKEDLMELPVANAVHPGALARNMPEEPLRMLNHDPFLNECKISGQDNDLIDLVVEGVPGVDTNIEARDKFRRKQRELLAAGRAAAS